ncbi:MAG: ABC transporter permease subunit [Chloroflexi bacterium]|nr:ABC transporter permease subunit [Chloroflexota bacterium]
MQLRSILHAHRSFSTGDLMVGLGLAALLYLGIQLSTGAPDRFAGPEVNLSPAALPYYALRSLSRMAAAYLLSLSFSLVYGYVAAKNRRAQTILLPLLDILQSIPILSFMPVVVLALVSFLPRGLGVELGSILLIFTSQAWNLTFAFYHGLIIVPKEMREAASIFRLNWWLQFKALEVPFATIGLVWNSMMSWAGGWFFLMAAEQFTLGDKDFRLLGLGSYLKTAAEQGNISALIWGLGAMVAVILLLDQFVWQPILAWADKFKLQTVSASEPPRSWVLDVLSRSWLVERFHAKAIAPLGEAIDRRLVGMVNEGSSSVRRRRGSILGAISTILLIALLAAVIYGGTRAVSLMTTLGWREWLEILSGAVATWLRVLVALFLALAWTLPLGVAIGTNQRLANRVMPVVQVVASVPATALFPILLWLLINVAGGLNFASILLMLLGTQWYLLFNIIAGSMAIPQDLRYTTDNLAIQGWERWRSFTLPALFPYLITGMITATGGAWNASVVSEYVRFATKTESTLGLGSLISQATADANFALLLASTLTMVGIVVVVNRLLWRRLYNLAEERFRWD